MTAVSSSTRTTRATWSTSARVGFVRVASLVLVMGTLLSCRVGEPKIPELRFWTDDLAFRVSSDPVPPRARERVVYKIVVRDKETGQPIEAGEGRIFATSNDRQNTWDSFAPGPELGTYYATLRFITAGDWGIAIQFRRDSTKKLERMDWRQEVRNSRGPGA